MSGEEMMFAVGWLILGGLALLLIRRIAKEWQTRK